MNEAELITLGEYCENLLKQETFTTLTELYEKQTVTHLLKTRPDEKEKRENIYASIAGVQDFMGLMASLVQQKNAIISKDNLAPSDDPDAQL